MFSLTALQCKVAELVISVVFFIISKTFITMKVTQYSYYEQVFIMSWKKTAKPEQSHSYPCLLYNAVKIFGIYLLCSLVILSEKGEIFSFILYLIREFYLTRKSLKMPEFLSCSIKSCIH